MIKQKITIIVLLSIFIQLSISSFSQTDYLKNISTVPNHPRILLLNGEEEGIRNIIKVNKDWRKIHQAIIDESDRILLLPTLDRVIVGIRLLLTSRECLRRVFYLSYAYRLTNDRKYFVRAEEELLKVSSFVDWHPSLFLDVSEMALGVSIGYDWLYNDLSPDSRTIIKEALLQKAIIPSLDAKYNSFLTMRTNHNQVDNAGISFAALALYEDNPELSKKIINRALTSIQIPMKKYSPDGAFPEGYGYWGYGTSFNILFLSTLQKVFQTDFALTNIPGFLNTATYYEHMLGPTGECFNYSDCFFSKGMNPAMFWFADYTHNPSLLYNEKRLLNQINVEDRILPAIMIWGKGIDFDKIPKPNKNLWVGQGECPVALMRTSWTDANAIFVGIKGGSPSTSHAHLDAGSFVIDAIGERWAMDLGPQEYNDVEIKGVDLWNSKQQGQRWHVFRLNNYAHNVLTVNDSLHRVTGMSIINSFSNSADSLSATTDITSMFSPVLKSAIRTIAIIDKKKVVVKDNLVNTNNTNHIRWTMLTMAKVTIKSDSVIELTQHHKHIFLKLNNKGNAKPFVKSAKPATTYENQNKGVSILGFDFDLTPNERKEFEVNFDFGREERY